MGGDGIQSQTQSVFQTGATDLKNRLSASAPPPTSPATTWTPPAVAKDSSALVSGSGYTSALTLADVHASAPAPSSSVVNTANGPVALYNATPSGTLGDLLGVSVSLFPWLAPDKSANAYKMLNLPDGVLPADVKNDPGYATLKDYAQYCNSFTPTLGDENTIGQSCPLTLSNYIAQCDAAAKELSSTFVNGQVVRTVLTDASLKKDADAAIALNQKLAAYASEFKVYDANPKADPLGMIKKIVPPCGNPVYIVNPGTHDNGGTYKLEDWRNGYANLDAKTGADNPDYMKAREAAGQKAYDDFAKGSPAESPLLKRPTTAEEARQNALDSWPTDPAAVSASTHRWGLTAARTGTWDLGTGDFATVHTDAGVPASNHQILLTSDPLATIVAKQMHTSHGIYDYIPYPKESGFDSLINKVIPMIGLSLITGGFGAAFSSAMAGSTLVGSLAASTGLSASTILGMGAQAVAGAASSLITGGSIGQGMLMGGLSGGLGSVNTAVTNALGDSTTLANLSSSTGISTGTLTKIASASVTGGASALMKGGSVTQGMLTGGLNAGIQAGTTAATDAVKANVSPETANVLSTGVNMLKAGVTNNPGGGLSALGAGVGGDAGSLLNTTGNVVNAVTHHNVGGALSALGAGIGGDAGSLLGTTGNVVGAITHHNVGGALSALGAGLGGDAGNLLDITGNAVNAVTHHNLPGMLAAGVALIGGPTGQVLGEGSKVLSNLQRGKPSQAFQNWQALMAAARSRDKTDT